MEKDGIERAERWADRIQLFALVIVLAIISAAVWLATFFALSPFIQDLLVQSLLATSVSLALAGMILIWRRKLLTGYSLVFLCSGAAFLSLVILWNTLQATAICIHAELIAVLLIFNSMRKRVETPDRFWPVVSKVLGLAILVTAPVAAGLVLQFLAFNANTVISVMLLIVSLYLIVIQYELKSPKLGIPNILLLSSILGLQTLSWIPPDTTSDTLLVMTAFAVGMGIGLLLSSQAAKRVQNWLIRRHRSPDIDGKYHDFKEQPAEDGHSDDESSDSIPGPVEWIITSEAANALSACATAEISIGIPWQFLWMASTTEWGLLPDFLPLMGPLALVFSLLVLAPLPVFLRLAERIRRETEAVAVRAIGFFVVFLASLTSYLWTAHFLWPLVLSVTSSIILFLVGITGLFRSVRRLWRNLWLAIIGSLRRVKVWILEHLVITGILCDIGMSLLVLLYFYPSLIVLPASFLSLAATFFITFTLIATIGVLALKRLPRRNLLISLGWTLLLLSLGGISFWYLYYLHEADVFRSLLLSSSWLYGAVLLRRFGIRRIHIAPLYLVCVFSTFYLLWTTTVYPSELKPSLFLGVSQVVILLMFHEEYKRAGKVLIHALQIAGRKLYAGLKHFARFVVQFILYSWAIILVLLLVLLNWFVLAPFLQFDVLLVVAWSVLLFLVSYLPVAGTREQSPRSLKPLGAASVACVLALLTFLYLPQFDLLTRVLASTAVLFFILSMVRSLFAERAKPIFYPLFWVILLSLMALQAASFSRSFVFPPLDLMVSILAFGIGVLVLKAVDSISRYVDIVYLVLVLPSSVLLTYFLTLDYLLCLAVLVVAPIPVAYQQYVQGLRIAFSAIADGLRILAVYLAIYIIAASAILAVILSGTASLFFLPIIFAYHSNPPLLQLVSFALIALILWLPALVLRRTDNRVILSVVSILFCILFGLDLVLALQIPDALFSILLLVVTSSFVLALAVPLIDVPFIRNLAVASFLCSIILLAIHVVPSDPISKVLLSAFAVSMVTAFSVPKTIRKDALALLGTSAISAFIFWNYYLISLDVPSSVLGFFWTEALLGRLAIPKARYAAWILFSVSSAILIALLLSLYYPSNILISCLALLELLAYEHEFSFIKTRSQGAFALVRACLLGGSAYFMLSQLLVWLNILPSVESILMLSILIGSLVFYASIHDLLTPLHRYALSFAVSLQISILLFILLLTSLQQPLFISAYAAVFAIIPFFLFQSREGSYPRPSWYAFILLAAGAAGFAWTFVTTGTESILLLLTTAVFVLSAGVLKTPGGIEAGRLATALTVTSFLIWLESIWLWGSTSLLHFSQMLVFVGACLIPLSTILFPVLGVVEWDDFRGIWTLMSVIACIPVSAILTEWDFFVSATPSSVVLTSGVALALYPLLAVPVIAHAESNACIIQSERMFHMYWIPSVLGWGFLGVEIGLSLTGTMELALGVGLLGSSLALLIFYSIMPERSTLVFTATLIALAGSLGIIIWFFGVPLIDTPILITIVILVIYAVSLPLTLAASIAAITWATIQFGRLLDAFVEVLRGIESFVRRNAAAFALIAPLLIGGLAAWGLAFLEINPLVLGISIRVEIFLLSAFFTVIGVCYAVEALALDERIAKRLQYPALGALAIGINGTSLSLLLPETTAPATLMGNTILLSISVSIICLGLLSIAFGMVQLARTFFTLLGITAFLFVFSSLFWLDEQPLLNSLWPSFVVLLLLEVPIFWKQVRIFFAHLADLGRIFAAFLRKLGALIADIFRKFGYYTWTFFSLVFVAIIGVLSRPFFSELLGAPMTGFFYEVHNFSVPLMILGLFSLLLAIVRRRVKSSFGIFSGILSIGGLGISIVALLFDLGHPYLSFFAIVLGICSSGLLVKGELNLDQKWNKVFWMPIPLSLSAVVFYFVGFQQTMLDAFLLSFLVSMFPSTTLYLVSTSFNVLNTKYKVPLWMLLGFQSGATVYFLSYLAVSPPFSLAAGLYLAVMTATVVSSVVTFQRSRQLFYAFLFFSITGFAYTSVLGSPLQGLALAVAAFLLFVSRYVKEAEAERPQLVYLRLVVLLALICSIGIFVVLSGLAILIV